MRAPRLSHTIEELTTAPGLDGLERVHLHAGVDDGVLADEALVADDDALLESGVAAEVGGPSERAAAQTRLAPDVHVVVADRALEEGVGLHDDVGAEHGVLADACVRPRRGSCRR